MTCWVGAAGPGGSAASVAGVVTMMHTGYDTGVSHPVRTGSRDRSVAIDASITPRRGRRRGRRGYNGGMDAHKPVIIVGGHGRVALRLARILSEHDGEVCSVIRNEAHADDVREAGAHPLVADVEQLDVDGLAELFEGAGAVVWAAGAGGGDPQRTYAVDRDAAIRSMDAAARAGVTRYVMVSYDGAGPDHGVPEDDPFFPYAEAKAAADTHLRGSDLEWTVLAPGRLTDEPGRGTIGVGEGKREDRETSRDEVAAVACAVLHRPDTIGRTIDFSDGDTPIGEALSQR